MPRRRKPSKHATGSAAQVTAMAFTAPFVIANRMTGMWLNVLTPTAKGDRENTLMVQEKMVATAESMAAANAEIARQAIEAGTRMMKGSTRPPTLNVDALLDASLKPYSKRVAANHRRLGKKP